MSKNSIFVCGIQIYTYVIRRLKDIDIRKNPVAISFCLLAVRLVSFLSLLLSLSFSIESACMCIIQQWYKCRSQHHDHHVLTNSIMTIIIIIISILLPSQYAYYLCMIIIVYSCMFCSMPFHRMAWSLLAACKKELRCLKRLDSREQNKLVMINGRSSGS